MSNQPRVVSLQAIQHQQVPSGTSSAMICGRCPKLLPMTVVSQACMPQFHISQGWGMVQRNEVSTFSSSKTSSRPSLAKPLGIHDLHPQTLRVEASCWPNSLGMTSWLLGCLECD
jgi:hypothetical protein